MPARTAAHSKTRSAASRAGRAAPKVRKIRASIRAGTYENDLKLSIAVDRLLERKFMRRS